MIIAALTLLTIGSTDLVRRFTSRLWIGYLVEVVLLIALGAFSAALLPAIVALVITAAWVVSMPATQQGPASFWPAAALAIVCAIAVALQPARTDAGLIGQAWILPSPLGHVPFDVALLALGVVAFLLESGNLVVRAALGGEAPIGPGAGAIAKGAVDANDATDRSTTGEASDEAFVGSAQAVSAASVEDEAGFKGGRLIGPLERVLVFLLTLTAAYPVLAAVIAAKGIVRFPEISRDGAKGSRAEYFLVGSLVSWVIAFGGAVLVWWGFTAQ